MLDLVTAMKGYKLNTAEGDIGTAKQFYFDDQYWTIRYLVANTGNWLTGRQVLISPYAIKSVSAATHEMSVSLTKQQLEASPSLESDLPVSKQYEEQYYGYYGWPTYWNGPYVWGMYPEITRDSDAWRASKAESEQWDPHLRSTAEVEGYTVNATDGDVGKIADFVIDDHSWTIRYLVVETGSWFAGHKVLVPPTWTKNVNWSDKQVEVSVSRSMIEHAPVFTGADMLTREFEGSLYKHYDRNAYWADGDRHATL
jgi:uncharacterized protein YrrD